MLTERSLNNAWNPEFSEFSVSGDWKEDFHPVDSGVGEFVTISSCGDFASQVCKFLNVL